MNGANHPMGSMTTTRNRVTRAWIGLAAAFLALMAAGCEASHAGTGEAGDGTARDTAAEHSADHAAMGPGADGAATGHRSMEHRELAAATPSDYSIYHAGSTWTDQHGTERKLRSLEGRVQVAAMVYTNCSFACPRIMLDLKRIEGELGSEYADRVSFLVVSIDPERDSPERLAEFAAGSRLDPDRWTLLTGDPGDIRELAVLLGVQYRQTAPGEWVHSNLITVLDRDGEVIHRQLGLGTDPSETLAAIRGATQ